jgi:hypothetical protein
MDPMSRWILIVIFIALAIWRLVRYLRLALGTRPAPVDTAGSGFTASYLIPWARNLERRFRAPVERARYRLTPR